MCPRRSSRRVALAWSSSRLSFGAAFGAETGLRLDLRPASGAEGLLGERSPALGAELAPSSLAPALGAHDDGLVVEIEIPRLVLALDLLADLLDLGLGLGRSDHDLALGRTVGAQAPSRVPADLVADPLGAVAALLEVGLCLLDGRAQGRIVSRATHGLLNLVGAVAGGG